MIVCDFFPLLFKCNSSKCGGLPHPNLLSRGRFLFQRGKEMHPFLMTEIIMGEGGGDRQRQREADRETETERHRDRETQREID